MLLNIAQISLASKKANENGEWQLYFYLSISRRFLVLLLYADFFCLYRALLDGMFPFGRFLFIHFNFYICSRLFLEMPGLAWKVDVPEGDTSISKTVLFREEEEEKMGYGVEGCLFRK